MLKAEFYSVINASKSKNQNCDFSWHCGDVLTLNSLYVLFIYHEWANKNISLKLQTETKLIVLCQSNQF